MTTLDTTMTTTSTKAKMRLYRLLGGVPNGSQERNTRNVAIHNSGAKPEPKDRINFTTNDNSAAGWTILGPFSFNLFSATLVDNPFSKLNSS